MNITEIKTAKKRFLPLLLLGDEEESMIDRYLSRGVLLVGYLHDKPAAVCVYTDEGGGIFEVKNLAVRTDLQRQGLGREMLTATETRARRAGGQTLRLGTGDSPLTLPFYEACGFHVTGRIPEFFTKHYSHPIFEGGRQLCDMILLEKTL